MEHGPFDPHQAAAFMKGLVDGGPTKSGHRTPTVIVTLPVLGLDEMSVKNNHWVIEQILTSGVHGLMLCHARNAEAVRMFVATARYQFERPELKGADKGIPEGLRGSGSQGYAVADLGHHRHAIRRKGRSLADEPERRADPVAEDGRQVLAGQYRSRSQRCRASHGANGGPAIRRCRSWASST